MEAQNKEQSAYSKLSPKRQRFVDEYLRCEFNGTKAAIAAKYSKRNAREQAARLLSKANIKKAIEEQCAALAEESKLKALEVVDELKRIGFSDITKAVEWDASGISLKDSSKLPPEVKACIASITETSGKFGTRLSIKFHDKVRALELLGRYLNMFTDKVQVSASGFQLFLGKPEEDAHK